MYLSNAIEANLLQTKNL